MVRNGKSFAARGHPVGVEGRSRAGDVVQAMDESGRELARGVNEYSPEKSPHSRAPNEGDQETLGVETPDEVIHRDNLTLTPWQG